MTRKSSLLTGAAAMSSPSPVRVVSCEVSAAESAARHRHLRLGDRMHDDYNRAQAMRDERAAWVKDQLERDIAVLDGCEVGVLNVANSFNSYDVRLLQWQSTNLAAEVHHTFTPPRDRDMAVEEHLREATTKRFAKMLRWQAEKCIELGVPKTIAPEDIDLPNYTIDAPLVAMLEDVHPDRGSYLRAILNGSTYAIPRPSQNRDGPHRFEDLSVSVSRCHLFGQFNTGNDQVTLKWSKGTLSILGLSISESAIIGCAGKMLQDIIEHPWFAHPMTITAVAPMRWGGMDGFVLNLRDTQVPIPHHW